MRHHFLIALSASAMLANAALADTTVQMHAVNAKGTAEAIGSVSISESAYGLVFTPQLKGLEPGVHGFHIHENPSCEPATKDGKPVAAGGAGDHFDPEKTGKHAFGRRWGESRLRRDFATAVSGRSPASRHRPKPAFFLYYGFQRGSLHACKITQ